MGTFIDGYQQLANTLVHDEFYVYPDTDVVDLVKTMSDCNKYMLLRDLCKSSGQSLTPYKETIAAMRRLETPDPEILSFITADVINKIAKRVKEGGLSCL